MKALVEFSFCLLEMISVTLFTHKFFPLRSSKLTVGLALAGFAAVEYSMEYWNIDQAVLVFIMFANMLGLIRLIFEGKTIMLGAAVLVFYIAEGILSALSIQFLTLTTRVSASELMEQSVLRILGGYFNKLAILIPILFMKPKPELAQTKGYGWNFRFCVLLLFICVYVNYLVCTRFTDSHGRLLSVVLSLALSGLLLLWNGLFRQVVQMEESKKRLELEHNCNTLKAAWLAETLENQDKFRRQRHDLKHMLGMLEYYLAQERSLEALDYVRHQLKLAESISKKEHTGNPIVDSLLNRAMDNEKQIQFHLETGHVRWPLEEGNTCLLISNLLDNAVEAAKQSPQKKLQFYLKEDESQVYLIVINSIKPGMMIDVSRSSKSDWREHGYGIQSIRSIVAQAHGELDFYTAAEQFEVRIILPKEEAHA